MKLLFDENLSHRLVSALEDLFPNSAHLRDVGLVGASDDSVWTYAKDHGFVLVSKDTDFYQRSVLDGSPPKVIWLRVGNTPTGSIAELLRKRYQRIQQFVEDEDATFLALD